MDHSGLFQMLKASLGWACIWYIDRKSPASVVHVACAAATYAALCRLLGSEDLLRLQWSRIQGESFSK